MVAKKRGQTKVKNRYDAIAVQSVNIKSRVMGTIRLLYKAIRAEF